MQRGATGEWTVTRTGDELVRAFVSRALAFAIWRVRFDGRGRDRGAAEPAREDTTNPITTRSPTTIQAG
jgi:hypothetical protein